MILVLLFVAIGFDDRVTISSSDGVDIIQDALNLTMIAIFLLFTAMLWLWLLLLW